MIKIILPSLAIVMLANIVQSLTLDHHRTSTVDLIEAAGYPAESHQVTTPDGYILSLHRIPKINPKTKVVLYLHGYQSSSADIVSRGRNASLGFLLSDLNYDVWMINFRGNRYSRLHTRLEPDEKFGDYWSFTWWEMGQEDLPAAINYILDISNQTQLQILGHGQGMTCYYVMLDQHPDLAEKISLASALSPISYTSHTAGLLQELSQLLVSLPHFITQSEFLSPSSEQDSVLAKFCAEAASSQDLCYETLFSIAGIDEGQQNKSLLTSQLKHFPAGTSARTIVHTAQNIKQGRFQAFDWGSGANLRRYGSARPPQVNLSLATPPQALYLPQHNDYLVQPGDYQRLIQELPNIVNVFVVEWQKWNHLDALSGIDAPRLLYQAVIEEMEKSKEERSSARPRALFTDKFRASSEEIKERKVDSDTLSRIASKLLSLLTGF